MFELDKHISSNIFITLYSIYASLAFKCYLFTQENFDWRSKSLKIFRNRPTKLTFTRPIGLPPHAPVTQKSADQRWLIVNSAKIGIFFR